MRAIVACGWFGIQAWIGGEALHTLFKAIIPGWQTILGGPIVGHTPTEWLSFLLFWGFNIYIIYRGMDLLRKVENWAAPFVLIMTSLLLGWAIWKARGLGYLLNQQSKFHSFGEFWPLFIISLTGMIGFWATLSLNMPDFTRFGKSQRDQAVGQVVALPTTMTVFAAMGVMITSAAVVIYPHMKPEELWDPMKLVGQFQSVVVIAISMFTVVVATLAVNIAANVVSPANDFANAFPKWISFRTGGLITGIVGILMQPWRLLADPSGYIFGWLLAYYQIPKALLSNVTAWGLGPIGVGFFIAFVFLVVGCFLDAIPAIVIVGTVLEPLARSVDLHPIQFAIISIVSLAFGLVTPPYGLCLMISCAVAGVRLRYALKDTMIMLVPMILVLAAIIIWPEIPLILPRLIAPELLK
jgi:cytosine/uracil/thiamine/allantoin permease